MAWVGSSLRGHFGFPLDDSWIHQTIGRNFASYHSVGFVPHQGSAGSTSLLWTVIVSLNYSFVPKLAPVLFSVGVNGLCLAGIGLMLLHLALRDGMHPAVAIFWAAAPAADGNFVWLAFIGMEHLVFLFLSLASVVLWLEHFPCGCSPTPQPSWAFSVKKTPLHNCPGNPSNRGNVLETSPGHSRRSLTTAILAGLCMGLLCMTRPEGIVFPMLLFLFFKLTSRTRRETGIAAVITFALAAVPFTVNRITSGSLLPGTLSGRRWLYFAGNSPGIQFRKLLLQQWITRPIRAVLVFDGSSSGTMAKISVLAIVFCILSLCAVGLYSLASKRRISTVVICIWGVVHSLVYVVILPASGHGGRYQTFLLLLLLPLTGLGLYRSLRFISVPRNASYAIAVLLIVVFALRSLTLWRTVLADGIDHINTSHGAMAEWLIANHVTAPLAVFDIGRIGYLRGGPIVDLGGLTDSDYIASLYGDRVPQYLRDRSIGLIVLPEDDQQSVIGNWLNLVGNPDVALQLVHEACTAEPIWSVGWIETRHAARCQGLFRMHFVSAPFH